MSIDRVMWFNKMWVSEELWKDQQALYEALKMAAPVGVDPQSVTISGFNMEARHPELGIQVNVVGYGRMVAPSVVS